MKRTLLHRKGFATATALFIVGIAGVAMAGVGALLAADVRRTLNGAVDAQLRQMLIAAEIDAPGHLADASQERWVTVIPSSLSSDGKVETQRLASTDGVRLRVSATISGRSLVQRLRFDHQADGWRLAEAELSP